MLYAHNARTGVSRFGQSFPLIIVLVLMVGLFAQVSCSGSSSSKSSGKDSKETSSSQGDAPNFKLESLDGETVELSKLKGKIVVIDFWATWCPPCRITLPLVNKVYEKTRGKDVEVFGISTDRSEASKVKAFIKKNNISMPILHDKTGVIANNYGVRGIPTMVIIDKKGNIHQKHVGGDPSLDKKVLKEIEDLLGD
ncbi:MAG: TlpA family protein disulfide reductase [Candidatus Coatesbacteria bacterium]|nr:TlpA family protein disulfide reductase [Candidatus Coatesbacteria bacterium]